MKIVSYNIRNQYAHDGINAFIHRAGAIYEKINAEKPDVIAFQEMTDKHLKLMETLFPEYTFVGLLRHKGYTGEGLYIAARRETFTILGFDTIFLSPTPYIPASRYEMQSPHPRICLETHLLHKETGKELRVFDLHLDHHRTEAQMLGMKDTLTYIDSFQAKRSLPFVLLGDFNVRPDSEEIALCNARPDMTDITAEIPSTFHGYGKCSAKIDYIYMSKDIAEQVTSVKIWDDEHAGIYLSDHYPVCAELEL
ncbi:MAG: endonuclease/exonuclease/phosphatase family protein [Clostridia bacterium]|nr:endonuclease/exonuclease/phosphatase family protein [Clostridia bacterium]